jgi:hypothetical protein
MSDRPILFSTPMVRAILAGTKTQTRRVVKPQPQMVTDKTIKPWDGDPAHLLKLMQDTGKRCPYGQPGDRLWVRETFGHFERNDTLKPGDTVYYRADGQCVDLEPWRPSIHMPRWASRITLEVTGVRVEWLQDINEADALAEGIEPIRDTAPGAGPNRYSVHIGSGWLNSPTAAGAYRMLWEQINGPGSWDANPWVWVVEFKRVTP